MKIRPMETELFRADRRIDRTKLISRFSQSPNTPKESTKITWAQANRQPFVIRLFDSTSRSENA
jgi:hypothetical protein